jgi:hypothetical protein
MREFRLKCALALIERRHIHFPTQNWKTSWQTGSIVDSGQHASSFGSAEVVLRPNTHQLPLLVACLKWGRVGACARQEFEAQGVA